MKLPLLVGLLTTAAVFATSAALAAPVHKLEVRVVIGTEELTPGSELELRVYETGREVRRLPLPHAEAWLPDSTHLIPVSSSETIETRNVRRFALYYRPASALAPPFEILSADVEFSSASGRSEKLLGMTLSGVIARQGELATETQERRAGQCFDDADCDDQRSCNGRERCEPRSRDADARGCVKGTPVVCPVNQVCGESTGCHGIAQGASGP